MSDEMIVGQLNTLQAEIFYTVPTHSCKRRHWTRSNDEPSLRSPSELTRRCWPAIRRGGWRW